MTYINEHVLNNLFYMLVSIFFLLFFIRSRSVFPEKKGASTIVAYRMFKRSDHFMYEISDLHRP
ncbi:hypothetical protein TAF16_1878 [Anoxybacillus flavithermus]|uniref:Uncharacterized protein n=1 Tax=Anoxybacillus flavithermus TaxID=33934 RepID=A0A178TA89_9BACL|nr:hypothetical protein TAF16_1878 [Anoxybacillus flavithermus]